MLWDIFCKVIDNHGDIGVCWRLSAQLAERGESVRLWVDDARALAWMAPQGHPGVRLLPWTTDASPWPPSGQAVDQATGQAVGEEVGDVVIEAFGCELGAPVHAAIAQAARARGRQPVWLNLEYLSAQSFVERQHGLPSPVLTGPATGLTKHFFFPGFRSGTGGLLREPALAARQAAFDSAAWLRGQGITRGEGDCLLSLFCYEPPLLGALLAQCAAGPRPVHLLVTAGRAAAAVRVALEQWPRGQAPLTPEGPLRIHWLPLLPQPDFDHLLWSCDLNFVRGEDSLVRALWAGKPLVWQIYPQDDDAHHAKLAAFLDWLPASAGLREFHWAWNGLHSTLPAMTPAAWQAGAQEARQRLWAQDDLATQLLRRVGQLSSEARP